MKILYLDTSSSFLYCAIVRNNICIGELKLDLQRDLSAYASFGILSQPDFPAL